MSHEPLVSVMMPCFNAEQTLPMALASLVAQSYENWEAVLVDDGSTDRTWNTLRAFNDRRIRIERFETNRGRGAARQRCLELANGEFWSFLDADDWLFPEKLATQVAIMKSRPHLAVLSGGCVITDEHGDAVGLMRSGLRENARLKEGTFSRVGAPPLSFPPCIIRAETGRSARFNPAFRRSQDSDFLIQILLGNRYAVSADLVYAYSQAEAASLRKTLEGYRYRLQCYAQYTERYPVHARIEASKTVAKIAAYTAAGWLGLDDKLIARRWAPITSQARAEYTMAKNAVATTLIELETR